MKINPNKQLNPCNCPECRHYQHVVNNNLYILIDGGEINFLEMCEKIKKEIAKNIGIPAHMFERPQKMPRTPPNTSPYINSPWTRMDSEGKPI